MSLRIWTVLIALAGLTLYTLSLLPASGYAPSQPAVPMPRVTQPDMPGATVVPLIYRDPVLIRYSPDIPEWIDPSMGRHSQSSYPLNSISIPERRRECECAPAHPFKSSVSLEVL